MAFEMCFNAQLDQLPPPPPGTPKTQQEEEPPKIDYRFKKGDKVLCLASDWSVCTLSIYHHLAKITNYHEHLNVANYKHLVHIENRHRRKKTGDEAGELHITPAEPYNIST